LSLVSNWKGGEIRKGLSQTSKGQPLFDSVPGTGYMLDKSWNLEGIRPSPSRPDRRTEKILSGLDLPERGVWPPGMQNGHRSTGNFSDSYFVNAKQHSKVCSEKLSVYYSKICVEPVLGLSSELDQPGSIAFRTGAVYLS
jgi:hypothetical protein